MRQAEAEPDENPEEFIDCSIERGGLVETLALLFLRPNRFQPQPRCGALRESVIWSLSHHELIDLKSSDSCAGQSRAGQSPKHR